MRSRRVMRQRLNQPLVEEGTPGLTRDEIYRLLCEGEILSGSLIPWGTNYTYYVDLQYEGLRHRAVYKPRKGEAPLIDFPSGTLYLREYAAYLASEWLEWNLVPQTVVRNDAPYGPGSLQAYVEAEGAPHVYSLGPEDLPELQKLVLFDVIVNNADRKPAHCFKGVGHGLWAIDHGLTFHARPKLRTVIWDFNGEPIPEPLLGTVEAAHSDQAGCGEMTEKLRALLSPREVDAFWRRIDDVLTKRRYPNLDPRYNIPYGFA